MKYNRYSKPSNSRKNHVLPEEVNESLPEDTAISPGDGNPENPPEEKELKDKPLFDFDVVKGKVSCSMI